MYQLLPAAELIAAQQDMQQRLLPAIMRPTPTNGSLLTARLKNQNKAITGANLVNAALALRDSIDWQVPPPPRKDAQMSKDTSRKNHAKPEDDNFGESHMLRDTLASVEKEKVNSTLIECRSLVESHRSYPHSKTYRERAALQQTLDTALAKTPNPTLKQAEAIKDALRKQKNGFPE